ncbi:hypothetical protein P43SY_000377 [Pythium insidiosum]|uniref:Kinesin motor domain-containing protein n=1 Tax=Pythium insidiosum TaxID=114742 RepID=A0AAD5LQN0_PYTIN|nr:hypothetical protein P43SY_000377 [Pythium insidiosum]
MPIVMTSRRDDRDDATKTKTTANAATAAHTEATAKAPATARHWRILRNALVSRTRDTESDASLSSVSTEFFPCFASRLVTDSSVLKHPAAESFEWRVYDVVKPTPSSSGDSSVRTLYVHEKRKQQRVSLAEIFSHQLNNGVDNTGNIRTWPSEPILLSYLLKNDLCRQLVDAHPTSQRIRCCELGSGMAGVVGLGLMAHESAFIEEMLITDGNPGAVKNLQICIDENVAQGVLPAARLEDLQAKLLRWDRAVRFDSHMYAQFDLVLASDCLFFEEFHVDLASTIQQLLRPETGRCLLLQPRRNGSMERFVAIARQQFALDVDVSSDFDAELQRQHETYSAQMAHYVADVHRPILLTIRRLRVMRGSVSSSSLASSSSSSNSKELQMNGAKKCVVVTGNQIEVKTADGGQTYTYDRVFDEADGQQVVFDHVARPVVQDLMDGYNATIFAYGQTSSGKTYTMEGASIDDPQLRGIIPRTATEIFQNVLAADENMEFIVKVSYIEIYMERIRDLLDPYKSKVNLQVREDTQRGIFVEGMTEISVTSDEELLSTMRDGAANRAVAATGMNEGSSRSHSVFMVTLFQRNLVNQATKAGKLYLVDLAGSEMVRKTGASGKQLEEAKTINKSLSALGNVINALTDSNSSHVPYRDSKLTRVLQESLGGNSKTNLIINVSPSSYNMSETISTLRFGNRAKSIKNKAVVNEQRSVEEYKLLLAKAEKAMNAQQTYIISLEARLASLGVDLKAEGGHARPSLVAGAGAGESSKAASDAATTAPTAAAVQPSDVAVELTAEPPAADGRLRRSSSIRAAEALEELQERVTQLEEELTEEKQESSRRAQEIRFLSAKVEEQAISLEATQSAADEFRKDKEQHEKQLEERLRVAETAHVELRAEFDRLSFEHQELVIHAEKVQREYDTLLQDLPSAAAAAAVASTNPTPGSPSKLAAAAAALAASEADEAAAAAATAAASAPSSSVEATAPETDDAKTEAVAKEEKEASTALAPAAVSTPTAVSTSESTAGESSKESIDLKARCHALEDELRQYEKEYRLLQVNTEREKTRLLDDLERKKAQIREMELQLTGAQSDGGAQASSAGSGVVAFNGPSGMSARERQHMRSIQQKLEQLVAVHRQLLRKYASLELELAEAKKKITLRDERIKQVEANNRIMAGNMRAQAEKHVEELTHLRDQIADFRGAQRSHFEAQLNPTADASVIKTLRGGSFYTEGVIRPIRGGGRRKTSAGTVGGAASGASASLQTAPSPTAPSSGFLTRLFGGKSS